MKIFYLILSLILIASFAVFSLNKNTPSVTDEVVWYGIPSKISASGDFRFYPSDKDGQRIDAHWFWAVPRDVDDVENIKNIYDILEENGVYKITGTRDEDNCNYYNEPGEVGDFPCVASLTLLKIERVGTTTDESPVQYWIGGTYDLLNTE